MIAKERIKTLNDKEAANQPYVVYWMQSAQRAECNHALEYAVRQANNLEKPLIVFFGITEDFPEANERHYRFMLEGLKEVKASLAKRNIRMIIRKISPEKGAVEISAHAVDNNIHVFRKSRTNCPRPDFYSACGLWQCQTTKE